MPRLDIPVAVATPDGAQVPTPQAGDVANGHQLANSGKTKLHVKNTNGASTARTVTLRLARTVQGQTVTSKTKSIPAGQTFVFGPFDQNDFGTMLLVDVDNAELTLHAVE